MTATEPHTPLPWYIEGDPANGLIVTDYVDDRIVIETGVRTAKDTKFVFDSVMFHDTFDAFIASIAQLTKAGECPNCDSDEDENPDCVDHQFFEMLDDDATETLNDLIRQARDLREHKQTLDAPPMIVSVEEMTNLLKCLSHELQRAEITDDEYQKGVRALNIGFEQMNLWEEMQ